ncbi:MAG: sulfotransferase [Deltaproteobacteria bacterium]|nr:sulfotransferase [Deltaproteobacteria bacterium]MBW2421055.1 sulfotransferase [Deltaproteobacteria bacterium]
MAAPKPNRPLLVRAINALGAGLARLGAELPPLDADGLLAAARRTSGLEDFGGDGFREGYSRFVASLRTEARLNTLGRVAARTQVLGYLRNRLELRDYRDRHPEVAEQVIRRPLFILGVPRTGTTVLFNLLAQDPANRAPLGWEVDRPCPPPEPASWQSDPRIAVSQRQFDRLHKLEPAMATIHEMGALLPQECVAITGHEFLSVQFHIMFDVPSYQVWVDEQSFAPAYAFHRSFLQHLQLHCRGDRWVLKSPGHLSAIEDLLAVYPDACIVHTHRDPLAVMPSLASLSYTLRGLSSDAVDPLRVGRQQAELWDEHLRRAMRARDALDGRREQFYDVHFEDVLKDPIEVVTRIYDYFGIALAVEARRSMEAFLSKNPRGKRGAHSYSLEDFGLENERSGKRFADYCERFGIESAAR